MKHTTWQISGSYGKKTQQCELFLAEKGTRLITMFHGCCGGPYDLEPTLYEAVAPRLAEEFGISCAFFESSRQTNKPEYFAAAPPKTQAEYDNFVAIAFGGKTLAQEREDAKLAHESILATYTSQRGQAPASQGFVGFSLGGLIAALLAPATKTDTLQLFGSAFSFQVSPDLPIIGMGINEQPLRPIIQSFTGTVAVYRGSDDTTTLAESSLAFFQAFTQARERRLVEWHGVDHRFRLRAGKPDAQLWEGVLLECTHL